MLRSFLGILLLGATVFCELYTSTHRMNEALRKDISELSKNLESYIAIERKKLTAIRSAVQEMKQLHRDLIPVTADSPGNPLAYYTFSSTFVKQWDKVTAAMNESDVHDGLRTGVLNSGFRLPNRNDMYGLVDDIVKSQPVFNLNASDIASGHLLGRVTTPLSSKDCYDIAKRAFAKSMERLSVDWLRAGILQLEKFPSKYPETVIDFNGEKQNLNAQTLETSREFAQKTLDKRFRIAMHTFSSSDKIRKLTGKRKKSRVMFDQVELLRKFKKGEVKHIGGETHRNLDRVIFYERLCQGIEEQKYNEKKSRFYRCFYAAHRDPYYRLRRIKMELKHLKPLILILHDVIYDNDINDMKTEVLHRMKRSVVRLEGAEKTKNVESRISISAYLEERGETATRLSKRISSMTRLNLSPDNVEGYKVSNYGPVGPFDPHIDYYGDRKRAQVPSLEELTYFQKEQMVSVTLFLTRLGQYPVAFTTGQFEAIWDVPLHYCIWILKSESITGTNRLLTLLSYLNNVDYGGSTVFPYLKVKIEPTKGSLVIFVNLKKNGLGDNDTTHASCPVVFGSKWIVAKYVHYRGQSWDELEHFAVSGLQVN